MSFNFGKKRKEKEKLPPLLRAIKKRKFAKAKELILLGADCSVRDEKGDSVLWNLSFQWNWNSYETSRADEIAMLELFKLVLEKGGDVNEVSSFDATPLIWATPDGIEEFFHDGKLLSLMLNYSPNIYLEAGGSFSCFGLATQNEEVLEMLAEKGLLKADEIPDWAKERVLPTIEKYRELMAL
ncbi:MAG: hypothetical protein J6Y30_03105 [Treponema sp.]|nr:hypothetical protein [Treponema sp.]